MFEMIACVNNKHNGNMKKYGKNIFQKIDLFKPCSVLFGYIKEN